MKKLGILLVVSILALSYSCKKKTCPAYQTDQEETYKFKGKRKKARLF